MDLLKDIYNKMSLFEGHASQQGVTAALKHVEVAEKWLQLGRKERNNDMFNDVIYRTNQAFEGMLKEAYSVLFKEDSSKLSSAKIESELLGAKVLSTRVIDLLKNYRQEWRNKSTHDHTLFFNEQEALLAIVSISAFFSILIDQVIEIVNIDREKAKIEKRKEELLRMLTNSGDLLKELACMCQLFSVEVNSKERDSDGLSEHELFGRMIGFVQSMNPSIKIDREPSIKGSFLRPDIIASQGEEKVIVEIVYIKEKRSSQAIKSWKNRLTRYMDLFQVNDGVLFLASDQHESHVIREDGTHGPNEYSDHRIIVVAPQ